MWSAAGPLLLVAALWGCTNPLLNRASRSSNKPQTIKSTDATRRSSPRGNPLSRLLLETWRLISNWQVSRSHDPSAIRLTTHSSTLARL